MDSPASSSKLAASTTESAPVQDSPVFSFISNLSPIQPVKAPPVTQGFPGINSPPLVFASPQLQLNPRSQPTFSKRSEIACSSASKLHGQDEDDNNSGISINGYERPDIQLNSTLISHCQRGLNNDSPVNDQIISPTGCAEQILTDVVNMDPVDSGSSCESTVKESEYHDQPPDAVTGSKELIIELDHEKNTRISAKADVSPPASTWETELLHEGKSSFHVSAVETDTTQRDGILFDHCPKFESVLPVNHVSPNKEQEDSVTENAETLLVCSLNQSTHELSESFQVGKENENFLEADEMVLTEQVLEKVQNDPRASRHHVVLRRCLQFEDAQHNIMSNQPAQNLSDGEGSKSVSLETPSAPINVKHGDLMQPTCPRNSLNSSVKIPKPSGIGLHLNSIVNAVQSGSSATVNVKSDSARGQKSTHMINSHISDYPNSSSMLSIVDSVSPSTDDNKHESHASVLASSDRHLSIHIVKPSSNSTVISPLDDQQTPGTKRKFTEKDCGSDEFQSCPKKKRKKSIDDHGCKRCNCKKTKCLKLYCDCFAAGIYCAESCACEGCFNRPEYEDTVLETRQQIESRNPLAFAPKVVQHKIEPPEDGTRFTPASARHKRGCNCKKSMCLKKYCECYQANVGCSDGCRCEGCKNVYGRKGEYGIIKDVSPEDDIETMSGREMVASHTELLIPPNLTPPTPAFQFSDHGKDASKAGFTSRKYFQTPESALSFAVPYMASPGHLKNSDNSGMISETTTEILDLVSLDDKLHYVNADSVDELSAVGQQTGEMGPLSGLSNPQGWANSSKTQSCLLWRGQPKTPTAQFTGTKHIDMVELSTSMLEDTPEILKDNSAIPNAVKASSPNKKRVSPPLGWPREFSGSSSSAGLRTGRKYILKAVPSFPPLTPYIDSKTMAIQPENDPEKRSGHR